MLFGGGEGAEGRGRVGSLGGMTNETDEDAARKKKIVTAAVVTGIVVVGVVVASRWFKRGGLRRTVKGFAEVEAVAIADRLVDELFEAV